MLLVLDPSAFVLFLVQVRDSTFSVLATFIEEANVRSTIVPDFIAEALYFRVAKVSSECLLEVCEVICALAVEVSILEISFIVTTLMPLVSSISILLAIGEVANILLIARLPCLDTQTFLTVVEPIAFISVAL